MPGKEQIEHRKLHRKIGKHRISYISYALLLVRKIRSLSWIHWKSWKHQSFRFTSRVCNDLLYVLWIALQSFWGRQFYVPVMMSGPLSWRGWLKIYGPSRTKCKIGITAPEIKDDRRIEDDPPFVLQEFLIVTVDICWYCCCCLWCLWTGGCSGSCSFVCFTAFEVGIVPIKQSNIFFQTWLETCRELTIKIRSVDQLSKVWQSQVRIVRLLQSTDLTR